MPLKLLVTVFSLLALGSALVACGGDDESGDAGGDDVEDVFNGIAEAFNDRDVDQFRSFFSEECRDQVSEQEVEELFQQLDEVFEGAKFEVEEIEVEEEGDDRATVRSRTKLVDENGETIPGTDSEDTAEVVKEDGKWVTEDCEVATG